MHRITLSAAAGIFIFLSACQQGSPVQDSPETEITPLIEGQGSHHSAIFKGDSVFDPATGTGYLLNPNWKIVTSGKPALQKGQGLVNEVADWSGTVITRTYECSSSGKHVTVACGVEADYVVVGGGAYADYGSGPGALLTESRPLDNALQTWVASSKDHVEPNTHTLRCYVIGMRIAGMSRSTLLSNMKLKDTTSKVEAHPRAIVGFADQDYVVVGVGARANWRETGSQGSLLTSSLSYWRYVGEGASKDHKKSNPSSITIYAIGINTQWFSGGGPRLERTATYVEGPTVSKGVSVAVAQVAPGWVLTGPGGAAICDDSTIGRLLFGIRPEGSLSNSVGVYSKDHLIACRGKSAAFAVQIQKMH